MRTCVLLLAVALCAAGQPDFRKAAWGMRPSQVQATEPVPPAEVTQSNGETLLRYDGVRLGGLECRVMYMFVKDGLVRAKFVFGAEHSDLNEFIRDFKLIEPILLEKHGKPATERAIWEDDSTQLEPKSYLDQDRATPASILPSDPLVGLAVSLGHLRLYARWDATRSMIVHSLSGHDHQITHQIEYRSAELRPNSATH